MKTPEEFKKEIFDNSGIPDNSDNRKWLYDMLQKAIDFGKTSTHSDEKAKAESQELLEALIEAEKHHQGLHSEIGYKLREVIKKATNNYGKSNR